MGGVLIFAHGPAQNLGMALVVGALFGLGAMIAQVWVYQVEKEGSLWQGQRQARFQELVARYRRATEHQASSDESKT